LHSHMYRAFEGPLTDCEESEDDDKTLLPPSQEEAQADKPQAVEQLELIVPDPTRTDKEKKRSKTRRRTRRLVTSHQVDGGKTIHRMRGAEASKNASFVLPLSMASTQEVASSGFVGARVPTGGQVISRAVLEKEHGMEYFNWNGLWVSPLSPSPYHC
jgi:hypothetical protein